MADYTEEEIKKLKVVSEAIGNLEGVAIPFNIIRQNIVPFANWLKEVLGEQEDVDDEKKDEEAARDGEADFERAQEEEWERQQNMQLEARGERAQDYPDDEGPGDDGQPDEQKEWDDAEGPELPSEEE